MRTKGFNIVGPAARMLRNTPHTLANSAVKRDVMLSIDSLLLALLAGIAAATMFTQTSGNELSDTQLRVAFDGDAVLFSDESEIIVKKDGLDVFFEHEKEFENTPLAKVFETLKKKSIVSIEKKCESFSVLISIMLV